MVFGIISDATRISSVSTAEVTPNHSLPNTLSLCAPTPAAPTVCAMVLSVRIAEIGRSMSCL